MVGNPVKLDDKSASERTGHHNGNISLPYLSIQQHILQEPRAISCEIPLIKLDTIVLELAAYKVVARLKQFASLWRQSGEEQGPQTGDVHALDHAIDSFKPPKAVSEAVADDETLVDELVVRHCHDRHVVG